MEITGPPTAAEDVDSIFYHGYHPRQLVHDNNLPVSSQHNVQSVYGCKDAFCLHAIQMLVQRQATPIGSHMSKAGNLYVPVPAEEEVCSFL